MKTKKIKTEIRKSQIAGAALNLISDQGMRGLTITAVSRKVGIVPSALYRHFKSKDSILEAILDLVEKGLQENVDKARKNKARPVDQLHEILNRHVAFVVANQSLPRILFADDVQGNPGRRIRINQIITGYLEKVAEIINQGQQNGDIRPEPSPPTLSFMFLGLIQPGVLLWNLSRGQFDIKKKAEEAWQVFLSAIMVRDQKQGTMNKAFPERKKKKGGNNHGEEG